ncbi:MAG: hypothetical protein ACTSPO_12390 [Candidatus Heimdallarchaeaceae archaeon]
MFRRIKGISNIAELVLTVLISSFLLKFILRVTPLGCAFYLTNKISAFDITVIILLSIFSIMVFLYFIFNEIHDKRRKIRFLKQRLVNIILSLLGLFYLFNWFDKFCIHYRIWVSIYSFIALPCCLTLPFIYIIVRRMKQNLCKPEKSKLHTFKVSLAKLWKTFAFIVYETLLVIVVIMFFYTLPIVYPFTNIGCALGLVYNVHYSTIIFLITMFLISTISFIKPFFTKKNIISDAFPLILLRSFIIITTLVGRKYFASYQQGNCVIMSQESWILIIATTWILSASLVLFLMKYIIDIVRGRVNIHNSSNQ